MKRVAVRTLLLCRECETYLKTMKGMSDVVRQGTLLAMQTDVGAVLAAIKGTQRATAAGAIDVISTTFKTQQFSQVTVGLSSPL